jgi:hypothetical protein
MATEPNAAILDATVRARRVARQAKLLDQAKGKWTWQSIIGGVALLALAVLFIRSNPTPDVGFAVTLLFAFLTWSDGRVSRRLDAIVRLLEERAEV